MSVRFPWVWVRIRRKKPPKTKHSHTETRCTHFADVSGTTPRRKRPHKGPQRRTPKGPASRIVRLTDAQRPLPGGFRPSATCCGRQWLWKASPRGSAAAFASATPGQLDGREAPLAEFNRNGFDLNALGDMETQYILPQSNGCCRLCFGLFGGRELRRRFGGVSAVRRPKYPSHPTTGSRLKCTAVCRQWRRLDWTWNPSLRRCVGSAFRH